MLQHRPVLLSLLVDRHLLLHQLPVEIALLLSRGRFEAADQVRLLGAGQHRRDQLFGLDEKAVGVGSICGAVERKLVGEGQADFRLSEVVQGSVVTALRSVGRGTHQAQEGRRVSLKIMTCFSTLSDTNARVPKREI